jgi:hypothetical protein
MTPSGSADILASVLVVKIGVYVRDADPDHKTSPGGDMSRKKNRYGAESMPTGDFDLRDVDTPGLNGV